MPLVATPGASDANSYVTVAEADDYFTLRLYSSAWSSASDSDKAAALVMATGLIDALFTWTGVAASDTQALAWPRVGMLNRNGVAIPETDIPAELKKAVEELALKLLQTDLTAINEVAAQGITSIKAGSVALTFKDSITVETLPTFIMELIPLSWYTTEADSVFMFDVL